MRRVPLLKLKEKDSLSCILVLYNLMSEDARLFEPKIVHVNFRKIGAHAKILPAPATRSPHLFLDLHLSIRRTFTLRLLFSIIEEIGPHI